MNVIRRLLTMGTALLVVLAAAAFGAAPAGAASQATVSILHAVPGATVDVYVNGKQLLKNFKPGTLTDPQMLPAGSYDLKVVKAGAGAGGTAVAEAKGVKVPGGANITVVAHLDADGKPILTPYVNDVSKIPAGQARVVVRHDAAAPAVDVRAGGKPVFTDLTNPNEDSAEVPAGTLKPDVVLAGTGTVVIGPASLKLSEGMVTVVYAWGSADDKNLKLAVQTISGMQTSPGGVPGGTGGQAALADARPGSLVVLGVALIGIAIAVSRLARRRVATSGGSATDHTERHLA
jgi:hypothetical protein